jgi:adenylyltransferase/sulfurtransferase
MPEPSVSFLDDATPEPARDGGSDVLYIDDADRYGRLRLIPWWRQEKLAAAKVLVVGAGALGNEVLKNLALLGVGTTLVIDLDTVEPSNLSRSVLFRAEDGGRPKAEAAAQRAREINPEVTIVPRHGDVITDVGLGTFAAVDVVIGCLDNREARLWVNRQCWKVGTPWVDAGIQEIQGVVKVFVPPGSACYECAMTRRDYELLNLRYSCPLLRREDCLSHETYPEPAAVPLGHADPVSALFAEARRGLSGSLTLALDRDLVTAIDCPRCGWHVAVNRPRTRVRQAEATCPNCREPGRPETASAVEEGSPLAARPLAEVGIPPYDIVRVDGEDGSGFFLLAADAAAAIPTA